MLSQPSPDQICGARREHVEYFLGVDIGKINDPTALVGLRQTKYLFAPETLHGRASEWREERPSVLQVGLIERIPLGIGYPAIAAHVARVLQMPLWASNVQLTVDATGVGQPVCDIFRSAGITFIALTITGGTVETISGNDAHVPKLTLISRLQALLHEGRLKIQKDLPDAQELVRELQDFRVDFTAAGNMTFGARSGKHDDLVLALAIAAWRASKTITKAHYVSKFDFIREV